MPAKEFVDTNVLVYALVPSGPRSAVSERLLAEGPAISVQVVNEFVNVVRRKLRWNWEQIENALSGIHGLCGAPLPLTYATHRTAVEIAKRYNFGIYDALILAAAIEVGCTTLYSEDMHSSQKIRSLTVRNPFLSA